MTEASGSLGLAETARRKRSGSDTRCPEERRGKAWTRAWTWGVCLGCLRLRPLGQMPSALRPQLVSRPR
ncbi:hypothetical protein K466DRAFT_581976 [Polyporus arcularius HHB13444]|uniref:Uncharacterized protein n=1 Tax=Polyporus arcularius HHB13444 TaxID=1314778 RepID=A0A5C3PV88_9APHY|nr:hypothetical protein K466DRAFT_581976 [Polyporus arcularius HHB13444]